MSSPKRRIGLLLVLAYVIAACAIQDPREAERYRWWSGLGPVLPHDDFPADCRLCHVGEKWHTLNEDFTFDHERETGVKLVGAHARAQCLRCHNDRGPVEVFQAQGCVGCHEDVHQGQLGSSCSSCHDEHTWHARGQIERHALTRFPLAGAHASTSCARCHPGAYIGRFTHADTECVTCHRDDLESAINPPHIGLGWVDNCDRCHMPTRWEQGRLR
ncbi:MAG: hypothetical protein KDB80_05630 [Planctomycetes bacterium]|nr:hypothetical protein [Planctomycetota bacterium]